MQCILIDAYFTASGWRLVYLSPFQVALLRGKVQLVLKSVGIFSIFYSESWIGSQVGWLKI